MGDRPHSSRDSRRAEADDKERAARHPDRVVSPSKHVVRPSVAAVVLAAGQATRMGGRKVLLPIGGRPMVQRVVDATLASKAIQTIVVVGHEADSVVAALAERPVTVVVNPDYAEGMSSSMRAGLEAVDAGADGALILLADQPFVGPALLDRLIDRFGACGKPIVRASIDGLPGNPVLVSTTLFPELARERGDVGGRRVVEEHQNEVCLVPVDDAREIMDIDSAPDYKTASLVVTVPGETSPTRPRALVKGGGDLATGVALRLHRAGFAVIVTEIARPTVVRRTVAFAEAVYEGRAVVEGIEAVRVDDPGQAEEVLARGLIPVLVDPEARALRAIRPALLVDAIVAKRNLGTRISDAPAVVALGPGFTAGRDVHAVVETKRGHRLGRVITEGAAAPNTGVPGEIGGYAVERLLRAPAAGVFRSELRIGAALDADDIVGYVGEVPVRARLDGVLRGLLHPGLEVTIGLKLGDIDARARPEDCFTVSDKALAVAGGVLEAACTLLGGVRF
jgi:xanthine dehydrogenase accessory factor